tara:strand:+ start:13948 stop:14241 length:294 start_codon:yes stop_codon:yes gene_type:complete
MPEEVEKTSEELVMDIDTALTLNRDFSNARPKLTKILERFKERSENKFIEEGADKKVLDSDHQKLVTLIESLDEAWRNVLDQLADAEVISNEETDDF